MLITYSISQIWVLIGAVMAEDYLDFQCCARMKLGPTYGNAWGNPNMLKQLTVAGSCTYSITFNADCKVSGVAPVTGPSCRGLIHTGGIVNEHEYVDCPDYSWPKETK